MLLMAGLTIVAMLVLQILVVFGALWLVYPHLSFAEVAQKPILLLGSQFLIYIAVAACMVMLVEGKYHAPFWQAIRWNWPRSQWQLLMLGAVMLLALGLLQSILPMPKDTPFEHLFDRPRDAYLLAIIAVSVGPLMEELFFRGFFYPVVARRLGSGLGNLSDRAAVCSDAPAAIWLGMGRHAGDSGGRRGVRHGAGRDSLGGG